MGWFENQIKERKDADQRQLEESFLHAAGVILGEKTAERIISEQVITKNAIDEIVKFFHCKPVDLPPSVTEPEEQLDYCLQPHGLMRRGVELQEGWYKEAFGPMLAFRKEDGMPVALLPGSIKGYSYLDPKTGEQIKVNRHTAKNLDKEAICFYKPLPMRKIGMKDLLVYMHRCLSGGDIVVAFTATLIVTLVGMLIPRIVKALTGPVLESGRADALIGVAICIICVSVSTQLISSSRELLMGRLSIKTSMGVQASMMMRILSLPASFFRTYSAGELKSRSTSVNTLCSLLLGTVLTIGLSTVTSLLYITQIFAYARPLVGVSLIILIVTLVFSMVTTLVQVGINRKKLDQEARESGMSYSIISGIQKIKLAGAEKRVFSRWLNLYSEGAELIYNPPVFIKVNSVISLGISLFSTIALYYIAAANGIDASSYFAFTAAFGVVMGAFMSLSGIALTAAEIRPILEMAEPFLKAEPEVSEKREVVTEISGGVELEHVYFRYSEDTPYILEDMSLKIRPGEYVAIVGKTGCGKSTLVRLLLGFEKPEKGAVYYDRKDLNSLNLTSLRRKIGTVMQSSGLFQGDIYSNIVISSPDLTMDDAWEAAEKAGIADDIRELPMGMHTLISEGQGGISGGQKQRLMIARAIAPKPKLLLFDEATSALDNKTQKQVSDALESMGCTRIAVAHRLSTIRHCDRILVLDHGKIIEEGNYDELIEKNGFFAKLVEHQRLDRDENKQGDT